MTKTTASPLSLTGNTLTIDLSNYSTTSSIGSTYQKKLTATSPLSLNSTTDTLSIDLSSYSTTNSNNSLYQPIFTVFPPLSLLSNVLSVDLTAYQHLLTVTKLLHHHYH